MKEKQVKAVLTNTAQVIFLALGWIVASFIYFRLPGAYASADKEIQELKDEKSTCNYERKEIEKQRNTFAVMLSESIGAYSKISKTAKFTTYKREFEDGALKFVHLEITVSKR